MRRRIFIAALMLCAMAACGRPSPGQKDTTNDASPSPDAAASPTASDSTANDSECTKAQGGADTHTFLKDIRVGAHSGFDRITFEFQAASGVKEAVPKYEVDFISPPISKSPSGEPMEVEGSTFARALFFGAERFNREETPAKRIYAGPDELRPGFAVLLEAELQEDFEATLSWILGLEKRACPKVSELTDPTRVVVDLPH